MAQQKTGMILIIVAIVLFLGGGVLVGMGVERFSAASESDELAEMHLANSMKAAGAGSAETPTGDLEGAEAFAEWAVESAETANRQRSEGYMWGGIGAFLVAGSVVLLVVGLRQRRQGGPPAPAAG